MNPILVIHAIGDKKRFDNIKDQFAKKYPYYCEVVPAIMESTARYGISKSHKKCIQLAKDRCWPYVIVAEDDVHLISPHSLKVFYSMIQLLPDDCDIFLGGIHSGEVTDPDNEVGYSGLVGKWSSLHLYMVKEKFYDRFLEADEQYNIDFWLSAKSQAKTYCAYPLLVSEISGWSYNAGEYKEYSKHICSKYKCIK